MNLEHWCFISLSSNNHKEPARLSVRLLDTSHLTTAQCLPALTLHTAPLSPEREAQASHLHTSMV